MSKKIRTFNTSEIWGQDSIANWWDKRALAKGTISLEHEEYVRIHDGETPGGKALPLTGAGATNQVGDKCTVYRNTDNQLYFNDYSVQLEIYTLSFEPNINDYIITAEGKKLIITNSVYDGYYTYTLSWNEDYYVNHDYYLNKFFPITIYSANYAPSTTDKAWIKPDMVQNEYYDQAMKIYGGGPPANIDQNHIHMVGKTGNVEVFLGTDFNYVSTKESGETPGRIRMQSETDIGVENTPLGFRRYGSWISVYGDDENADGYGSSRNIYTTTVDVDKNTGDIFAGGVWDYGPNPYVMKLDRNGGVKWRQMVPEYGFENATVSSVAYDRNNNRVGVTTELWTPGPTYAMLHEFNADTGEFVGQAVISDVNESQNTYPMALKYNNEGKPVVVGYTYGDPLIINSSGEATPCVANPHGKDAKFNIDADGSGTYSINQIVFGGTGYSVGDKIRIPGTSLNGTLYTNDAIVTVIGIAGEYNNIDTATISGVSADVIPSSYTDVITGYLIDNNSKAGIIMLPTSGLDFTRSGMSFVSNSSMWYLNSTALTGDVYMTGSAVGLYQYCIATGGSGTNAQFHITVDYNTYTYSANVVGGLSGYGYVDAETVTIPGSWVGGIDTINDVSINISVIDGQVVGVNSVSGTPNGDYIRFDMSVLGYNDDFSISNEGRAEDIILGYYGNTCRSFVWTPDWVKNISRDDQDIGYAIAMDLGDDNSIYVTGHWGSSNALVKLLPDGTLSWASDFDATDLESVAYCGDWVYVADSSGAFKVSSWNGNATDYFYLQNGYFSSNGARLSSFRENGQWYLYIFDRQINSDWYSGDAGYLVRKVNMDLNIVWAREIDALYYDSSSAFYDWSIDYNDYEKCFAVGPYGAVMVGSGYWYSDNYYNGIIMQISTADDTQFEDFGNPRLHLYSVGTSWPGPSFNVYSPTWSSITSTTNSTDSQLQTDYNPPFSFDWNQNTHFYRIIHENLNKSHHDIECVEGISFAHGGDLRHNPIDIPPAAHDFTTYSSYYLENSARGKFLRMSPYSGNVNIYVPGDDVENFPVGSVITFVNMSSSYMYFYTNSDWDSVYIYAAGQSGTNYWKFAGVGTATLMKTAANEWLLTAPNVTTA